MKKIWETKGESQDVERKKIEGKAPCIMLLSTPTFPLIRCVYVSREPREKICSYIEAFGLQPHSWLCASMSMNSFSYYNLRLLKDIQTWF